MKSQKIFKGLLFLVGLLLMVISVVTFVHVGAVDFASSATGITAAGVSMASLSWDETPDNIGGFTCEAYLGFSSDIATYPALAATPTDYEGLVNLVGSYTMKTSKKFIDIYVTSDTFKADADNQGENDGQSFKAKGEFFFPGTKAECLGFCKAINNQRGILIGIDPNDGTRYNWGTKGLPVRFKPKVSWGAKAADKRGALIAWEVDNSAPALIYKGSIPLTEADIPAIS